MESHSRRSLYRLVPVAADYPFPYKIMPDGTRLAFAHRLAAEAAIGRLLRVPEVVHHIDGNPGNNSPDNLHICASPAEHRYIHKYGLPHGPALFD